MLCARSARSGWPPATSSVPPGVVEEFFGMTRLDASSSDTGSTVVVGTAATPTAAVVNLPAATSVRDAATFENVEGMLVRIPDELTAGGRPRSSPRTTPRARPRTRPT